MHLKISRFGFLTVSTRAQRDDNLKGVLARSKRKSKAPVTLPSVGKEVKHGKGSQGKARAKAKR